jgi:PAS domain S-box-containing protein
MKAVASIERRPAYPLLLIFALLTAGIITAGSLYYRNYERNYRAQAAGQLTAIADLKVAQIVQWRRERLLDAHWILASPYAARRALDVLARPDSATTRRMFTGWLAPLMTNDLYARALLLDGQLQVRAVEPAGASSAVSETTRAAAQQALRTRQVMVVDLGRSADEADVHLDLLVPVVVRREGARDNVPAAGSAPLAADRGAAVLLLQVDAHDFLYPFLQRWPTPSATAETLLVRREGNEAVYLNKLRFQTNTALTLRLPLGRTNCPAVMAILGTEGVVEGEDYRNARVLAALRAVPDSPWFLVARQDAAEVFAPLRERLWLLVFLVGALLLGTGAGTGLLWRQQGLRFYREQAQAAAALRQSERLQRTILDNIPDPAWMKDLEGRFVEVNQAWCRFAGWTRQEAVGRSDVELFPAAAAARFREQDLALVQTGQPCHWEESVPDGSGNVRHFETFKVPASDAGGQAYATIGIARDITQRRQAEAEIRQLNQTLEQRVAERTAQLLAANKELESFSYSVSHDLRAPLRHVQGYVNLLAREAEGQLSAEARRFLKTIADASQDMGVLIDNLLSFSRMSRAELSTARVPLDELVRQTLRDLEPDTRARNIVWQIPALPAVQADPALLKLVLVNLLGNAVKFTRARDPARIEIGCAGREGAQVILFVRDNGVGFDPRYASKLFGVFQRLHRADEFEGTGIGLANVQRIVARHGGRAWAEGQLGAGATFYLTLQESP